MTDGVTRILIAALGGEGGGVLLNWIVAAARGAGHVVQATSVPGVAQRTGATSYYIEVAPKTAPQTLLGLVPLAGRLDLLVSSELIETPRVLQAGFVSPDRTMVVSSTARFFSTAEKINLGDGRYQEDNVRRAIAELARESHLLDLRTLAKQNGTFISATMFGALAGCGALPWDVPGSRAVLTDDRSRAGFDAALAAVQGATPPTPHAEPAPKTTATPSEFDHLPTGLRRVVELGADRMLDYQDADYRSLFLARVDAIVTAADLENHRSEHAATESIRRLALWMTYEDVARVADLKTRPDRFARIRAELELKPGQTFAVTDYMKPRAEEIADILPVALGRRIMARVDRGGRFPFLGKGRYIRSNGVVGYRLLRFVAAAKHIRRRSLRYVEEQAAIDDWLVSLTSSLARSPEFALALGELPRVLKGYSDTLMRGKRAYAAITDTIVRPAVETGTQSDAAQRLQAAIGAALADDTHSALNALFAGETRRPPVPILT
jgi:indolepyruvate ferredoxin oxidoreductase beta subunit